MAAFVDEGKPLDLTDVLDWTPDCAKRLMAIRGRARENEEERGIQTMFVALGTGSWKATDGGRDPMAPIFLLPVTVAEPAKRPQLTRNGDLVVNRVMLQAWEEEHKHKILAFDPDEPIDMPILHALGRIAEEGKPLEGFSVSTDCYLGNFSFAKLAMVEDLKRNEALLALNRLICAIAGDPSSQQSIREDAGTIEREDLDNIDSAEEIIVLEADEYQRQAIHSLTKFDADGVIDGPPGTGKSQTIANLIAALVADGKRVLFVAEKRAALDAVLKRLADAGLDDFVLDLHGAEARRKNVYDRLRNRDERARLLEDRPTTPVRNLNQLRDNLNAYYRAVNARIDGCELSVREIISRLSKLDPEASAESLWFGSDLDRMTVDVHELSRRSIELLAQDAPLFRRERGVPWSRADLTEPVDAANAIQAVMKSRIDLQRLGEAIEPVVRATGTAATTFDDITGICWAIRSAAHVRSMFSDDLLDADVDDLSIALRPLSKNFLSRSWAFLFNSKYRSALSTIRSQGKPKVTSRLKLTEALATCVKIPREFRTKSVFVLISPARTSEVLGLWERVRTLRKDIAALTNEDLSDDVDASRQHLVALETAHRAARRLPGLRKAEAELVVHGYAALVDELKRTNRQPAHWPEIADNAWLRSYLERARNDEPSLGGFSRESFEKMRDEFRELDAKQLARARMLVRRGAAESYLTARNKCVDQATIFRGELQKKTRYMPIRKLVSRAGDVITALCPCWMASPLSVSQLIPGDRTIFDIVIFDEASQILPEDAVPSIMRGKRTIVAGDQKQLPPTTFFASGSPDPEEDEEEYEVDSDLLQVTIAGMESILDVMLTFCNRQYLNVHYRSLDESLIRFSNHEFYHDRLITFPSAGFGEGGLTHELVESPHVDGEELSSSAEISRVADLVLKHAEERPDESLGVITLGLKHARRLEAIIEQQRKDRLDLDEFFSRENVNTAFFVKNLERVQGDERDAIILSLGYAKDGAGNLKNKLGPVNHAGGERRLNVAVSRSKSRMTVVSTFTENDMEQSRFAAPGAKMLCRYLSYARKGGARLDDVAGTDVEINDFERDVMDTLAAKGLMLVPQLGVSKYRLDLAVLHPKIPNRYVLAIECDGAPYHSSATARDRDRLRQSHLESRGWRFHRIWSLDWYEERPAEIERAMRSYAAALALADEPQFKTAAASSNHISGDRVRAAMRHRSPKPHIFLRERIDDYAEPELQSVIDWICSDGLLRSDDEILVEVVPALGFHRRGRIIDERIRRSIDKWRRWR